MNLLICYTPLQILIATKLIESSKIKGVNTFFIYYNYNKTVKTDFYCAKLREMCRDGIEINKRFSFGLLMKLRFLLRNKIFDEVYLASVNDRIAHYILSFITFDKLYTYDDGTANIFKNSFFYENDKSQSSLKSLGHYILGRKFYLQDIISKSYKHYTIYNNKKNIIDNIEYIDILSTIASTTLDNNIEKECNVVIGSVLPEILVPNAPLSVVSRKIKVFVRSLENVTYICHPRDKSTEFDDYTLNKHLIFEDIISQLLMEYQKINLYGFVSSAHFNILNINTDRVNCFVFVSGLLKEKYAGLTNVAISEGSKTFDFDKVDVNG